MSIKPRVVIAVILFLLPATAIVRSQAAQSKTTDTVEQELRKLTGEWDQALLKRDIDTLNQLLANDYVFAQTPKSYYLAALETPDVQYNTYERRDITIRVYNDSALVIGRTSVNGKYPGVDWFTSTFNSMDVWIKQNGQWKCVATMHDEIKGETSSGRVQVGPKVKVSLVIVFKSGATDQQVNDFLRTILQRPNPYGEGYKNQTGVRSILKVPPIDEHQALAVTFHEDTTQAVKEQIKARIKSDALFYKIFEDVSPSDVKLK